MLKKPDVIQQVYNDGVIKFYSKSNATDEFGTPILGGGEELELTTWYRVIGSRAEDVLMARSLGEDIDLKIALRGKVSIDIEWSAKADKDYEVYFKDYNPRNRETIVSLKEVRNEQ